MALYKCCYHYYYYGYITSHDTGVNRRTVDSLETYRLRRGFFDGGGKMKNVVKVT